MDIIMAGDLQLRQRSADERAQIFDFLDKHVASNHTTHADCYSARWNKEQRLLEIVAYHKDENGRRHMLGSDLQGGPAAPTGVACVKFDVPCDEEPPWYVW